MSNYQESVNTVTLCGKIVKIYNVDVPKRGCSHLLVTLNVGRRTFPQIYLEEKIIRDVRENLQEGQIVTICGNIQHSNLQKKGQVYAVWGTSLKIENPYETILYRNEFYLEGIVHRVEIYSPKKARVFVKTNSGGHKSLVPVTIFNEIDNPVNFEPCDSFKCCGVIQTGKRTIGGKDEFYEIYVAKKYV